MRNAAQYPLELRSKTGSFEDPPEGGTPSAGHRFGKGQTDMGSGSDGVGTVRDGISTVQIDFGSVRDDVSTV